VADHAMGHGELTDAEFLSSDFLRGCLFGRARSHDGPQDPEYVRIEDEVERFAFLTRRVAADKARDARHHDPPGRPAAPQPVTPCR
jgi:hypothetical protein